MQIIHLWVDRRCAASICRWTFPHPEPPVVATRSRTMCLLSVLKLFLDANEDNYK